MVFSNNDSSVWWDFQWKLTVRNLGRIPVYTVHRYINQTIKETSTYFQACFAPVPLFVKGSVTARLAQTHLNTSTLRHNYNKWNFIFPVSGNKPQTLYVPVYKLTYTYSSTPKIHEYIVNNIFFYVKLKNNAQQITEYICVKELCHISIALLYSYISNKFSFCYDPNTKGCQLRMPLRAARPPKTFPLLRMFATKKITRASVRTTRISTYKVDSQIDPIIH